MRELTGVEIAEVRARIQQVNCVNCGAPIDLTGGLLSAGLAIVLFAVKRAGAEVRIQRSASVVSM